MFLDLEILFMQCKHTFSRFLFYYSIIIVIFAVTCVFVVLPYLVFLLIPFLICHFKKKIPSIEYCKNGAWKIDGKEAILLPSSVMWRYLMVLHFKLGSRRSSVVVMQDSLPDGDYRWLRRCIARKQLL